MSVIRRVKVKYNLNKIEKICQKIGLYTEKNVSLSKILGYRKQDSEEIVHLAVSKTKGDVFNFGFIQDKKGITLLVDKYYSENENLLTHIITEYVKDSLQPYYELEKTIHNKKNETVLIFRR